MRLLAPSSPLAKSHSTQALIFWACWSALTALSAPTALLAQTASTTTVTTTVAPAAVLTGEWTGTLQTEEWTAELKIRLQQAGDSLSGTMTLNIPGNGELAGPVREVRMSGNAVTWLADIQGVVVRFTGGFEGKVFGGYFDAYQGEQIVVQGDWNLARGAEVK